MGDWWEILVVPIIVVAIWIIRAVFSGGEEAAGDAPRRKGEKTTDLDRFLREVRRRKQTADREEERPRRAETRARRSTAPREEVAIPVALPVEEAPASGAPVLATLVAAPLPAMPADASARSLPPPPESAALVGLRALLRSREGLRKAMILHEVLGPPRSRRQHPR
jgi:hypothetical protein